MARKSTKTIGLALLVICCLAAAALAFVVLRGTPVNEDVEAPDSLPVETPTVKDSTAPENEEAAPADVSETARALMSIYPVSYVRSGDAEPTHLELADWATACLQYVDPSSALGQALTNNPDSVAAPLGYYEVAAYAKDVEVTEVAGNAASVTVTIEGTQQDWDHTMTFDESFVLQFNEAGLVTEVTDAA